MTKKSSLKTSRFSATEEEKKAEHNINVLLYYGIGSFAIMTLISTFLPNQAIHIYAILLTIWITTATILNKKKKHKKQTNA